MVLFCILPHTMSFCATCKWYVDPVGILLFKCNGLKYHLEVNHGCFANSSKVDFGCQGGTQGRL